MVLLLEKVVWECLGELADFAFSYDCILNQMFLKQVCHKTLSPIRAQGLVTSKTEVNQAKS